MLVNLKVENIVVRMVEAVLLICLFLVLLLSAGCSTAAKETLGSKTINKHSIASRPEEIEDTHFQSLRLRPERDTEELGVLIVSPDGKVRRVK